MQEHCSPWGSSEAESGNKENCQGFEDSFTSESYNSPITQPNSDYIPLDDSSQYLEGLERKLSRVQGRTSGQRKKESQQLIDALAGSRSCHTHNLLQNQDEVVSGFSENNVSIEASSNSAAIAPDNALGVMMRRVVPDKVALSHEELCQLLEADILAKVTEAAQEEEDQCRQQSITQISTETECTNQDITSSNVRESHLGTLSPIEERKGQSSDEGEK